MVIAKTIVLDSKSAAEQAVGVINTGTSGAPVLGLAKLPPR